MSRSFIAATSLLLSAALCQSRAIGQPNIVPETKTRVPSFSVAGLEEFLGGRTLVTLDLKDARLEEVAAALGASSGQKITARPVRQISVPRPEGAPPVTPPPAPLFTWSAQQKPFWEALREMQIKARRAGEAANALDNHPGFSRRLVPNSVGLQAYSSREWLLQADNSVADGRAVAPWPFLVVATDIRRSQEAKLSDKGLEEMETRPIFPERFQREKALVVAPIVPKTPVSEAERWLDGLTLSGQAYVDPKLKPSDLRCEVLEAIDEKGNDLRLTDDNLTRSPGIAFASRNIGTPLRIPLRSKPGMGKRLVKLRGVLRFNVVTRSHHWETTQLQTPIDGTVLQDGGEFKVQFKGLEKNGDGWKASFAAQSRGAHLERMWNQSNGNGFGFRPRSSTWGVFNFAGVPGITVVDENGGTFEANGPGTGFVGLSRPNEVTPVITSPDLSPVPLDAAQNWVYKEEHSFQFQPNFSAPSGTRVSMGKPAKLIMNLPLERREVSVPFEFTDLPLPPS